MKKISATSTDTANLEVPPDLDPMDFYEEYFEWIMKHYDGGWKDLYIQLFEDCWRFEDFIEEKHPELLVAA